MQQHARLQTAIPRVRGAGLIALVVGLAVGLIVVLSVMQSLAVFEGQRRTTVSTDHTQQNGLAALFEIEREMRMAGHSMVLGGNIPCVSMKAYNYNASPASYDIRMTPVLIRDRVVPEGDQIEVAYADSKVGGIPITVLTAAMLNSYPETAMTVEMTFGIAVGDRLLLSRAGVGCARVVATAIAGTTLTHSSGSSGDAAFNPPSGTNIFPVGGFAVGSLVTNIGQLTSRRFEIVNGRLMQTELAAGSPTQTELVANVVHLQARYGVSTAATSDVITAWVEPTGGTWGASATTPNRFDSLRIKAVRVAVVARSDLVEKEDVALATLTLWPGGPTYTVPDRKYRYRVFETIVPMRNALWGNPNPTP